MKLRPPTKLTTAVLVLLAACAPAAAAGRDLPAAGSPCPASRVVPPEPSPQARRELEAKLAEARAAYERNPSDADAAIWLGRRAAYLGRFEEAIAVYTKAVSRHPRDARLYRHRGHRYLTLRCFGAAVADLERAARLVRGRTDEVEPDGLPNARGIPTSTLNSNVFYHLGLAHYLRGDFRKARAAYRECLKFSKNPDMLVATVHWLYMTLRRLKRDDEARRALDLVDDGADIIESQDYERLVQMYKGRVTPEEVLAGAKKKASSLGFASVAYGVGNWHLYHGRADRAAQIFRDILRSPQQTSFGFIAAEAELSRMSAPGRAPE